MEGQHSWAKDGQPQSLAHQKSTAEEKGSVLEREVGLPGEQVI